MDYTKTEAWARGVELAKDQLALQPPDDRTVSVSLDRLDPSDPYSRSYYRLCQICGWARAGDRCPHGVQIEALRETPSELPDVPDQTGVGAP